MNLKDYLDQEQLKYEIANGWVKASHHPTLPLVILCYTRRTVLEDRWNAVTTKCRGLIVDQHGEIVSRPFEKFFNIATHTQPETWLSNLPRQKPTVTDKLDGNLGIFYTYPTSTGEMVKAVASKGSFISKHAIRATALCQTHTAEWPEGYTPVFECLVESVETHVVQYGIPDELVLIGLIHNLTGAEASYESLHYWGTLNGYRVADLFAKTVGDVIDEDRNNREGYVLTWERPGRTPLKVKVKHPTFLKMQRIVHSATPKAILEALMAGDELILELWCRDANSSVRSYIECWTAEFRRRFGHTLLSAARIAQHAEDRYISRKDAAEYISQQRNHFYAPLAFAFLDRKGKEVTHKIAWRLVQQQVKELPDAPAFATDDTPKEAA